MVILFVVRGGSTVYHRTACSLSITLSATELLLWLHRVLLLLYIGSFYPHQLLSSSEHHSSSLPAALYKQCEHSHYNQLTESACIIIISISISRWRTRQLRPVPRGFVSWRFHLFIFDNPHLTGMLSMVGSEQGQASQFDECSEMGRFQS